MNYYPINSFICINNSNSRVSILTKNPIGVTIFNNEIEFMIHRKPEIDDEKGLVYSVNDDYYSNNHFKILYEEISDCENYLLSKKYDKREKLILQMKNPILVMRLSHHVDQKEVTKFNNILSLNTLNDLYSNFNVYILHFQIIDENQFILRFIKKNFNHVVMNLNFIFKKRLVCKRYSLSLQKRMKFNHFFDENSFIITFLCKF
jgi:hypothetical protein